MLEEEIFKCVPVRKGRGSRRAADVAIMLRALERPRLKTKKTLGDRAFLIAAPFLWNSLPLPIRQETSIESFKRSVKTYLFRKAFS